MRHGEVGFRPSAGRLLQAADLRVGAAVGTTERALRAAGTQRLGHLSAAQVAACVQPTLKLLTAASVEVGAGVQVAELALEVGTFPTAAACVVHLAGQAAPRRGALFWPAGSAALALRQQAQVCGGGRTTTTSSSSSRGRAKAAAGDCGMISGRPASTRGISACVAPCQGGKPGQKVRSNLTVPRTMLDPSTDPSPATSKSSRSRTQRHSDPYNDPPVLLSGY